MPQVVMRDQSSGGHVLGGAIVEGVADPTTLGEIVEARIRGEVADYNADPGPVYHGLVAPEDSIRYSDGLRMQDPRPLDADRFVRAAREAVGQGIVRFRFADQATADLSTPVEVATVDEIVVELARPIIARAPGDAAPGR